MSVQVEIVGENANSDEYEAALKLKEIIKRDLKNGIDGKILLYASITILGQEVKDIDLIMIGELRDYSPKMSFFDSNNNLNNANITIKNFCTTIEIKSHSADGVLRKGTDFYVKYGVNYHCVTLQSNKQKYSLMNFLKSTISFSPFISNMIWFTQLTKEDVHNLLSTDGNDLISNILGNDFSFDQIMQLMIWQNKPFFLHGNYIVNSIPRDLSIKKFHDALNMFSEKKASVGTLTRKRIEEISNNQFKNIKVNNDDSMEIIRGKAGSGKTVNLINYAIYLIDNFDSRVLMLTYNKALVSDLKRLFTFANLPDMFHDSCLDINTMQSFFFIIINNILFNGKLSGEFYLKNYNETLGHLIKYINQDDNLEFVKEYMKTECNLDWDYILIDEAQDWSILEKNIILKLYDGSQLIIADGGNQFVRNVEVCDWSNIKKKKNVKLKYCLRQKKNIVNFINHFSNMIGQNMNKIKSNDSMLGGKVIIMESSENIYSVHKKEFSTLLSYGNIGYDMMYLVPSNMVIKTSSGNRFKYSDDYKRNGINFWDGTNQNNRSSYSINEEEVRLFQYDSSRGLEAWTVVCINFDEFINEKLNYFSDGVQVDSLFLESVEDKKRRYILNWALIPLTRAIDTLVITLANEESYVSKILIELAEEYSDYITMIR